MHIDGVEPSVAGLESQLVPLRPARYIPPALSPVTSAHVRGVFTDTKGWLRIEPGETIDGLTTPVHPNSLFSSRACLRSTGSKVHMTTITMSAILPCR